MKAMLIPYTEEQIKMLARSVESAIFQSLMNAQTDPEKEEYWRSHADKLERKFTTEMGKHYSYFIY